MYQEHENVSTRLQRLMQAQQDLDNTIVLTASRARSPSPLLYPRPLSPKLTEREREETYHPVEAVAPIFPQEIPVNDEWLNRMKENRAALDQDEPVVVERVLVTRSPRNSMSPARLFSPEHYVSISPRRLSPHLASPPREPVTNSHSFSRPEELARTDWVTEALEQKLSPSMRERIRRALQRSLVDSSSPSGDDPLSPGTRETLRNVYQQADQGSFPSHRVLYDVIYSDTVLDSSTRESYDTEVEFAEFRSWLDRSFEEPHKVKRAVSHEVLDRVRSAWRVKDTRIGADTVRQLKVALKQAETEGADGKRYLFELVDLEDYGTKPEFERWCQEIFGEYPSPPRFSTPPRDRNPRQQWDELQSPMFQKVPKPARSSPVRTSPKPSDPSPWGDRWQPADRNQGSEFGPNAASLFSIAAVGEIAMDEMSRQGYFEDLRPRTDSSQMWRAPDMMPAQYE